LHESVVQGLASLHVSGTPAVHTPPTQVSAPLHALPSGHGVASGAVLCPQPVVGSQVSVVQGFPSLQLSAVPAMQTPARHVSVPSQTFPLLQSVPSATAVYWHPEPETQVSVVHGLLSLHGVPDAGTHNPDRHVAEPQRLPSVHAVPSARLLCWQPATGSQESVVHALPSSQLGGVPGVHPPDWQVSKPLQTLPSLQPVPFGAAVCWQPFTGSHESTVHGEVSVQFRLVPGWQMPDWQTSMPSHRLPSLHEAPLVTDVW
jgi:hypothetical protein